MIPHVVFYRQPIGENQKLEARRKPPAASRQSNAHRTKNLAAFLIISNTDYHET
jgi:hypothetical protein